MMKSTKLLGIAAFVLAVSGCKCNTTPTGGSLGDIGLIYDEGGVRITSTSATYDFDKVSMGVSKTLKLTVTNTGKGPLTIAGISKTDGADAVQIGGAGDMNPVFTVAFPGATTVAIGQEVDFDIVFNAPLSPDPMVKTTDHLVNLKLALESANTDSATVTLQGTAVSGACDLPKTLDFGAVAVGDTFPITVPFVNVSPIDTNGTASDITSNSGDDKNFEYAPESSRGSFPILAGKTKNVIVQFKPTENRDYLALVKMRAAEACPEITVRLIGTGVTDVLTVVAPDFGYVQPGLEVMNQAVYSNQGFAIVKLTGIKTVGTSGQPSADYRLVGAAAVDVPAAVRTEMPDGSSVINPGTATVQLAFKPTVLGRRDGNLVANSSLLKQPTISAALKGFGGGPDIDVKPAPILNFGKVPFFTTAQTGGAPYFVTRKLSVQNVGTRPPMPDQKANLHLGKLGTLPYADGTTNKFWDVKAKAGTSALDSEICVGRYDTTLGCVGDLALPFDNQVGVVAGGAASIVDVPVRITPADANGDKEWEITVYSNDPDEAAVVITVKVDAVILPPCNAAISPTNVNFGLVTPPSSKDLSFSIRNLATAPGDICLISGLDMKTGSDPIFSLPNGAIDTKELQPGEQMNVSVRAWPQGSVSSSVVTATGAVHFSISNPTQPERDVTLNAAIATSCLTIAPSDLDFGTVKKDCFSSRRVFSIYNTCQSAVTVQSFGMVAAAGEAAGGPNCPGAAACPEFLVDGTPGFAMGTTIPSGSTMPITFALKYRPINYGQDNGAYLIKVTQNSQTVDYVITLRGNGDMTGTNTDIFRQDTKPKADILLVIDDSGSMSDKQMALAQNFASFIKYATTAGVDYQLAVVVTEIGRADEGHMRGDVNNPKILKPTTPNVETLFKQKVDVGLSGGYEGIAEPATLALTAPLITSDNAGFLRADAVLAVVGVTDAADQSPAAAPIYENQLRNIKGAQRPNQFSYSIIGPFAPIPPPGCSYDEASPDVSKHQYLVTRFNGVREEICSANWATALETIGKNAFGYRTNFFLTAEPQGGTVTVAIDGVTLAPTDPRGAPVWHYDATSNAVDFEPLFVPEPGRTLSVTYVVQCLTM